jgi:plastocyanin
MRGRRVGFLAAVVALSVVPVPDAWAQTNVAMKVDASAPSGFVFDPSPAPVLLGDDVLWQNQTGTTHSATSNQRFWTEQVVVGATISSLVAMDFSGRYLYHCKFHPLMRGAVDVSLAFSAGPYTKDTPISISWASNPIPSGQDMDIQVKRPADTRFRPLFMNQTTSQQGGSFTPKRRGLYRFRVRRQVTATSSSAFKVSTLRVE